MEAKEGCITVTVCPWCGLSAPPKFTDVGTRYKGFICEECGAGYNGFLTNGRSRKVLFVPKKSIGLKNKRRDKFIRSRSGTAPFSGHFAGFSYIIKEKCVQIVMCPWCGCSTSNFKAPSGNQPVLECEECGTEHGYWATIMVPERSLGLRDANLGKQEYSPGATRIFTVCPWCRNPSFGYNSRCKECGTVLVTINPIFSSGISDKATGLKDKNMDKHIDE